MNTISIPAIECFLKEVLGENKMLIKWMASKGFQAIDFASIWSMFYFLANSETVVKKKCQRDHHNTSTLPPCVLYYAKTKAIKKKCGRKGNLMHFSGRGKHYKALRQCKGALEK